MFDIESQPMITRVRCRECRASLEVDSDHRPTIERAVATFETQHHCRQTVNPPGGGDGNQG